MRKKVELSSLFVPPQSGGMEINMQEWEKKFDAVALGKAMTLYQNGKVETLKNNGEEINATIASIPRYEVTIVMKDGMPTRMKCQCPKYRSGRSCEHIAAALYGAFGGIVPLEREKEKEKARREAVKQRQALEKAAREDAEARAAEAARIAQEEAERKAAEEAQRVAEDAEKERKRQEVAERIAQRDAEKKAKKAERKRKRLEAEQAVREAALEASRKREEEERKKQEELEEQKKAEQARMRREEEARKAEEMKAAQKKEQKVQAAIARKAKAAEEIVEAEASFAAEEPEYISWDGESVSKSRLAVDNNTRTAKTEEYSYFDIDAIKEELELSKSDMRKGQELLQKGLISIGRMQSGYTDTMDDLVLEVTASARTGNKTNDYPFSVQLVMSGNQVLRAKCGCKACRKNIYYWYENSNCAYVAGLLEAAAQQIQQQNIGDATDKTGVEVLASFHSRQSHQVMAEKEGRENSLQLEPRLSSCNGKLNLSFRVGEGKRYVVKDLFNFCHMVRNAETGTYGNSTQINHSLSNFTERSRQWYQFLNKVIREEEELERRIEESMRYSYRSGKCSYVELYGWRLDQFYEELGKDTIEYEEKNGSKKIKQRIAAGQGNPRLSMQIRKSDMGRKKVFHGIEVFCRMPVFYSGMNNYYYVEQEVLRRTDAEFVAQLQPLEGLTNNGLLQFRVGRNNLSEFYYSILPHMQEYFDVMEENSEEIHSYLPPEVEFVFYLDARDDNMTCKVHALYGGTEVSVSDILDNNGFKAMQSYRMVSRESEILYRAMQFFPEIDIANDELHCGQDEYAMYQVLAHGVDELLKYGEVRCTQRFKGMNLVRRAKVSVGVSVSQGLLNLEITTEDVSREELLDILKSYRSRQRYYRLKNGDFLNLENDSLELLSEMMNAMHLSPKEFVKGKMQLPAYRTLYLDKMLEEKDDIYLTRDRHFKELVKSFKTIKDADYEAPEELSALMRGYQKNGYKWLRTLGGYGFGGILADDMGLGKTLQAIAVLLAVKQEEKGGCALVVCPSSLVFNWMEELKRFAPQLNALAIVGNQEQRRSLLKEWNHYDVLVTSYDLLKRDILHYEEMQFEYEIIDEAQYIKNHTTAAAKAVKVIRSRLRLALTGTPIENRLSELWSIFDYLMPGFLYGYDTFKREFETPIAKNGDEEAMKRLQRMTGPFILRRLKQDVLKDLPDKLEEVRYVQLEDVQRQAYDAQVVHMQTLLAGQGDEEFSKNKLAILAELTRLRQICCDPSLCFDNYRGESAKLEACMELIMSAIDGGHKMLLFSQFTTMLDIIRKRLEQEGIAYYSITGETAKEQRLKLVKSFNEDAVPVFLISLKAGGVGLNLTGADVVIHYDPWWNVAAQEQATDRAHRIGQTKKVTVYKMIVKNSVEEKILKLQELKRNLADSIVNAQSGQLAALSREELLGLLEV